MADYKAAIVDAVERQGAAFEMFANKQRERIAEIVDRLEEIESKGNTPGAPRGTRESKAHVDAFTSWLRKPTDPGRKSNLTEIEAKAVTIASNPGGGHAVPEEISREIERLEKLFSPVRSLVKVVRAGTSDFKQLVNIRGAAASWAGESTDRSTPTATPQLREVVPTWGELYGYPEASEWSLDDVFFDVADWLAEEVAQEFAIAEGQAVIDGDGSNKLTGMVNSAPTDAPDFNSPLRAAAVYQFVASLSTSSPAVAEVVPDALIDLVYAVNSAYRARGTFVMNSTTMGAVRKLKDGDGNYLWQPSTQMGQPDRLLGYPVQAWEQMPAIAANALPIGFGDFQRGYLLVQHAAGLRITVDQVTRPGYSRFFIRRREAGIPLNVDAIKFLKTTTS
jgi:HK97 family phage major capsid protein